MLLNLISLALETVTLSGNSWASSIQHTWLPDLVAFQSDVFLTFTDFPPYLPRPGGLRLLTLNGQNTVLEWTGTAILSQIRMAGMDVELAVNRFHVFLVHGACGAVSILRALLYNIAFASALVLHYFATRLPQKLVPISKPTRRKTN